MLFILWYVSNETNKGQTPNLQRLNDQEIQNKYVQENRKTAKKQDSRQYAQK